MRVVSVLFLVLFLASPAASSVLDLTTPGATGCFGDGCFLQIDPQSTGTGIIDPFLRLQANGHEKGFNTDYTPLEGDLVDVKQGPWTHSVLVGDLHATCGMPAPMYRFLLDVDEEGAHPLISLDELRVYTSPVPNLSDMAGLEASNLVYDMGEGNKIYLDYSLNHGSGSGDMFFFLPASLFDGLHSQYLYLYSHLGATGGDYESTNGPEEWATSWDEASAVEQSTWGGVKSLYR